MIDILFTKKYKSPNISSHGCLRGEDRAWRRGVTAGAIGGMGGRRWYFDLQVQLPGIAIFHKCENFYNHGGIYRFERKFAKIKERDVALIIS